MIERRALLGGSIAVAALVGTESSRATTRRLFDADARLQDLERGDARLGVCFIDTATGEYAGNRVDEYFAFCSTFKLALVGAYLREADAGRIDLTEVVPYGKSDLLSWAPRTSENLSKGGMTIGALAQAAQEVSDGTAANLLVRRLGGPGAVTSKFREMGDEVMRLDRYEPALGLVLSADRRDTTTPLAMAKLVAGLTTGDLLAPASQELLITWMRNTVTGFRRLRAGLPEHWRSGNKTGTGRATGTTNKVNDVAITFPPGRAPVVIAAYYDSAEFTEQTEDRHQAVLAAVGEIAAEWAA
jgi:beta-lactamase class A